MADHRRRPAARPTAGVGRPHVFGYPGDGINGILGAFSRADDQPRFIQSRHEEMSALPGGRLREVQRPARASAWRRPGPARSTCSTGCTTPSSTTCRSSRSSGRPTARAMGGSYQQEVDLLSLFKDVASDYVQTVTVPEQLPNVLDRAIRTALGRRAPTAIIIPNDVQELEYAPPPHEFKMVPSSLGLDRPRVVPDDDGAGVAPPTILNAGTRVAMLVGQGARGAARRGRAGRGPAGRRRGQGAARQGRPQRRAALGDRLHRAARDPAELRDDAGLRHPAHRRLELSRTASSCRSSDQARAVQIDIDGSLIGMRYPYEVNLVGDAATTLRALIPLLERKDGPRLAGAASSDDVRRWWQTMDAEAHVGGRPDQPDADLPRVLAAGARRRDRRRRQRVRCQLVRPPASGCAGDMRGSLSGHAGHHGTRRAVRHRREVRPPGPAGDRASRATARCR